MVSTDFYRDEQGNIMQRQHYYGLSTDEKPTKGVPNGSVFDVMDKATRYLFDAENEEWNLFFKAKDLDTTDATATASDILSGKTAYVGEEKITGELEEKTESDITVEGNVVTIPKGCYSAEESKVIGTAIEEITITPAKKDQTIAANSFLMGTVTVKGDANLMAKNIKAGVTIFGIKGTYTGE